MKPVALCANCKQKEIYTGFKNKFVEEVTRVPRGNFMTLNFDPPASTSRVLRLQACANKAQFYVVQGIKPRVSCVVGNHSVS